MRCPRCRGRAMSVLRWFGHSLWQPRRKAHRWEVRCRKCNATLDPSDRDRLLHFVLPSLMLFAAFGVTWQLPEAYRPHGAVNLLAAIVSGLLLHYFVASYECLDEVPIPEARSRGADEREQ